MGIVNETFDINGTLLKKASILSEYVLDTRQEKKVGVYTTFSGSTIGKEIDAVYTTFLFSPEAVPSISEHCFTQCTDVLSGDESVIFRQNER